MADTIRTFAEILALFADNNNGDVSPQDMRDFVVTQRAHVGGLYVTTPVATTFSDTSTAVKVLGTTALISNAVDFDMPVNNRLRYIGAQPIEALFVAGVSMTCGSNNQNTRMSFAKNGTVIEDSVAGRKIGTGSDEGRGVILGGVQLNNNDYIEAFLVNTTGTNAITYTYMTMITIGFII